MKTKDHIIRLIIGFFYIILTAIAFIVSLVLFIYEMTIMFIYSKSIEFRDKMLLNTYNKYLKHPSNK